jgi:methionine-rich copper-binding protein CopC
MALNISKQIDSKPKNGSLTQDFMQKHKITVNEPVQTHFSVEGVQTYSADEIKAMKIRADRVNA